MSELVSLAGIAGHLAIPKGNGPWPGLIVIQEWWGLSDHIKSVADRFASAGYLAFAPDLFHGELARLGDNDTAMKLTQKYGPGAPADLQRAFDALKDRSDCRGKVGSVGFCFGGRMSLALGISRPVNAVCVFYGGGMQQLFDQLGNLHAPVLGLFGDKDQSIPLGTVEEFDKLLGTLGLEHEVIVYPNSGHAFFRDSDPGVYKPEAAKDAWERALKFFARNLS
ncbi:MAG TPA: dienelactone hydrolase family protein [Anaerolineales bacterium]|nr:dienelactone hydrolase family protein [Anaerolineales bacterium]